MGSKQRARALILMPNLAMYSRWHPSVLLQDHSDTERLKPRDSRKGVGEEQGTQQAGKGEGQGPLGVLSMPTEAFLTHLSLGWGLELHSPYESAADTEMGQTCISQLLAG